MAADYVRAVRETELRLRPAEGMTIPPVGTQQQQIYRSAGIVSAYNSQMMAGLDREMLFL